MVCGTYLPINLQIIQKTIEDTIKAVKTYKHGKSSQPLNVGHI
jgi:hypothetical protein